MRKYIVAAIALLAAAFPTSAAATQWGVGMSGCNFAAGGDLCPLPHQVRAHAAHGATVFRIPIIRAQFKSVVVRAKVKALVDAVLGIGGTAIIDHHSSSPLSANALAALWIDLSRDYPNGAYADRVIFELQNEPSGMSDPATWLAYNQRVITLLRGAGVQHRLYIQYGRYSGTNRLKPYVPVLQNTPLRDPLRRIFLVGHRYMDENRSGMTTNCMPSPGIDIWAQQLRAVGMKGAITEWGDGSTVNGWTASCKAQDIELVRQVKANSDVIVAMTAFDGGRGWATTFPRLVTPVISEYLMLILGR